MEYDDADFSAFSSTATQDLSPCSICGRNFNPTALQRHIPICQKAASKKRKVFDSAKHRADGTDIVLQKNRPKPGQPPPPVRGSAARSQSAAQAAPKSNWRAKHQEFISNIRAARGAQKAMAEGGPLPPPPPPSLNPDYVQCPYCTRRFNETAAQRHINFCKEQQSRLPNKKTIDKTAQARADARKQYGSNKRGKATGSSSGYGTMRTPSGLGATNTRNYSSTQSSARGQSTLGGGGSHGASGYNASRYAPDSGADSPGSGGRMLRTGRTTETYTEARQLSANQRSTMPPSSRRNAPASTGSRYGGSQYGGASSRGGMSPATGNGYKHNDNGYYSADSGDSHSQQHRAGRTGSGSLARFCHECGTKYPVATAKFCCECGIKRMALT